MIYLREVVDSIPVSKWTRAKNQDRALSRMVFYYHYHTAATKHSGVRDVDYTIDFTELFEEIAHAVYKFYL